MVWRHHDLRQQRNPSHQYLYVIIVIPYYKYTCYSSRFRYFGTLTCYAVTLCAVVYWYILTVITEINNILQHVTALIHVCHILTLKMLQHIMKSNRPVCVRVSYQQHIVQKWLLVRRDSANITRLLLCSQVFIFSLWSAASEVSIFYIVVPCIWKVNLVT